jgi:hypothetical protein
VTDDARSYATASSDYKTLKESRRMSTRLMTAALTLTILLAAALPGQAPNNTAIEQMPEQLETRWALSALPPALRDQATVFVLDPAKGYRLARQGTNGFTCLIERTAWELVDFRNDIYIPLCHDAAGTKTLLRVKMDAATLRAQGMRPAALKAEIERRYQTKVYRAPERPGLSYMTAPVFRAVGPPDLKVHTLAMPHLMFYAPFVTNEDIAAAPNLADPSSLAYPFIDQQGIAQQSVMIQMLGDAEKARILAREKGLVDDLCAYRDVLCLPNSR